MADRSSYYSTVATLLPLFALALLVERRIGASERSTDATSDAYLALGFLASCAFGEFAAFVGLTDGPSRGANICSGLALGLAGVLLIGDLAWAQVSAHNTFVEDKRKRKRVRILAAVIVFGALAALLLFGATAYFG